MNEYSKKEQESTEDNEEIGIYSEDGHEDLMDNEDEITDIDEGFMKGYDEEPESRRCKNCNKRLDDDEVIPKEVDGKIYKFCSQHCLTQFEINNEEDE